MARRHPRGQALVEFALILPILLFLVLGAFQVGIGLIVRYELQHAATQAAISGASEPGRCDTALAILAEVYGRSPDHAACTIAGRVLEISAGMDLAALIPVDWRINVDARGEIRGTP